MGDFVKPKVLLILHLPPPYHGVAVMNEIVRSMPYVREVAHSRVLKMEFVRQTSEIGRFSCKKLVLSCKLFISAGREMLFFRPDIVYMVPSPHGYACVRDVLLAAWIRLLGGNILFHLHGRIEFAEMPWFKRWLFQRMFRNQSLISLTERLAQSISGLRDVHVNIVHNAAHEEIDDNELATVLAERDARVPVLLFFSNLTPEKGVFDFITVVRQLISSSITVKARIAGNASREMWQRVEQEITTHGLGTVIEMHNNVNRNDRAAFRRLYTASHIFVLPTYYRNEASPLVLIDALQFGMPVVATSVGGIPDMIRDGINGFIVPPRDIAALTEAVQRLVESDSLRRDMALQNRKDYEERFSVPAFERNMERVFSSSIK